MHRLPGLQYSRKPERGFTLIETMIAMVVLLLTLLAMLAVVPFGFTSVQANALQVQAVSVGQQYLDGQRNALLNVGAMPAATTSPVDAGQSFVGQGTANSNYGTFTITPDGCSAVAYAGSGQNIVNVHLCSVTVSWTDQGVSKSTTVQSYVTK